MMVVSTGLMFLAGFAGFLPQSQAQQQNANNQFRSSGWFKTCGERNGSNICNVQYRVVAPNGANVSTLNLVESKGKVERRVFQIIVPTGRSLPPGIQIQVDGKRAAAIPYLYCRPKGCTAEVRIADDLINVFKKGGRLDVTSINFQGQQQPVPVTLKGFTAAFDGPPVKPEGNQNQRQQNLANELKKKAEEERQKQEAASE